MSERPIIFGSVIVPRLLDDSATQTRRVLRQQPTVEIDHWENLAGAYQGWVGCSKDDEVVWPIGYNTFESIKCPYGKVGDLLWVRETWRQGRPMLNGPNISSDVAYRADYANSPLFSEKIWKPSIFMSRWAARIWRKITGIRVEQVQDISEKDAKMEGCDCSWLILQPNNLKHNKRRKLIFEKYGTPVADISTANEQSEFAYLWDFINAEPKPRCKNGNIKCYVSYPWEAIRETREFRDRPWYVFGNPFVWVIDFKRIRKD